MQQQLEQLEQQKLNDSYIGRNGTYIEYRHNSNGIRDLRTLTSGATVLTSSIRKAVEATQNGALTKTQDDAARNYPQANIDPRRVH